MTATRREVQAGREASADKRSIVAERLAAQWLLAPADSVAEAAASQLATQAQDFAGGRWALGLRAGAVQADVDLALARGEIVRSWPMRGTLMIAPRDDIRWLTELMAPRSYAASRPVWARAGLAEGDFARAGDVARDVLAGGRILPRLELLAAFHAAGVPTQGSGRGPLLLRRLAGDGVLVFGPPRGTAQTLVLLDDWVPEGRRLDRDEALRELAVRFFAGHGPATVADLAWWSGLTLTDLRRGVEKSGDALRRDGDLFSAVGAGHSTPDRSTAAARAESAPAAAAVHLLPGYDELLLGYRDRAASLAPGDMARIAPTSNGLQLPVVTVGGRVVGTWRRELVGAGGVAVAVDAFGRLSPSIRTAVERRAAEYAAYLGRDLVSVSV